jgi:hypothetical protein
MGLFAVFHACPKVLFGDACTFTNLIDLRSWYTKEFLDIGIHDSSRSPSSKLNGCSFMLNNSDSVPQNTVSPLTVLTLSP